jgi:hypothetical protein
MNRKLVLSILGVVVLAAALVPHWNVEASKPVPVIVSKQSFINQTSSIGTTALFTPAVDGDYRISLYVSGYVVACNSGASTLAPHVHLDWTDDLKSNSNTFDLSVGNHCAWDSIQGFIIHATAGNPINVSTTVFSSDAGNYYFTVEEL